MLGRATEDGMHGFGLRRREGLIVVLGLAVSMLSWLAFQPWNLTDAFMIGAPFGRDFVNFWIAPHLVIEGRAPVLGDIDAYNAAIREGFGYVAQNRMIFSYPPHALLLLLPFGLLPYLPALLLWTGLNLAALAAATRLIGGRPSFAALACLSPAAAAMAMYGHFGGLLALGATLAVTESGRRPRLAGLCLALMSVKPQFALVLGLLLLCAGRLRCLLHAAAFATVLVALSLAAFGWAPWLRFVEVILPLQSRLLTEFAGSSLATATSFYVTARFWDLSAGTAWAIQAVLGGLAFLTALTALRGGPPSPARLVVVLSGALLALPYANHYDLAVAAPALTLLVLDRTAMPEASPAAILVWLIAPLAKLLAVASIPVIPLAMAAALVALSRRLDTERSAMPAGALPCSA